MDWNTQHSNFTACSRNSNCSLSGNTTGQLAFERFALQTGSHFKTLTIVTITMGTVTAILYNLAIFGLVRSYQATTKMLLLINLCIAGLLNCCLNITYGIYSLTMSGGMLRLAYIFLRFRLIRLLIMNILTVDAFLKVYLATHHALHQVHKNFKRAIFASYFAVCAYQVYCFVVPNNKDIFIFSYVYLTLSGILTLNIFATYTYLLYLLVRSKLRQARQKPKKLRYSVQRATDERGYIFTVPTSENLKAASTIHLITALALAHQNDELTDRNTAHNTRMEMLHRMSTSQRASSLPVVQEPDEILPKTSRSKSLFLPPKYNHKKSEQRARKERFSFLSQISVTAQSSCCKTIFSMVFLVLLMFFTLNMLPQVFISVLTFKGKITADFLLFQGLVSMLGSFIESTIYILNSDEVQNKMRHWRRVRKAKKQVT